MNNSFVNHSLMRAAKGSMENRPCSDSALSYWALGDAEVSSLHIIKPHSTCSFGLPTILNCDG